MNGKNRVIQLGDPSQEQYVQRFQTSPVWTAADNLRELIDGILAGSEDAEITDQGDRGILNRAVYMIQLLLRLRESCDPRLISPSQLFRTQQALDNCRTQIASWFSNRAFAGHSLQGADGIVDELLGELSRWPTLHDETVAADRAVAVEYSREAIALREQYRTAVAEAAEAESRARSERQAQVDAIALTAAQNLESLRIEVASIQSAIARANDQMADTLTRSDAQLTREMTEFSDLRSKQVNSFADQITDSKRELAAAVSELRQLAQTENEARNSEAQTQIAAINSRLSEASTTLAAVQERALTAEFGARAEDQANLAKWWSITTVVSIVAGAGWLVYFILDHPDVAETSWSTVVYKLGVTVAGVALATYAAAQATEYRREARRNKRTQIVLATSPAILDKLSHEEAAALRIEIAKKTFLADTQDFSEGRRQFIRRKDVEGALELIERAKAVIEKPAS